MSIKIHENIFKNKIFKFFYVQLVELKKCEIWIQGVPYASINKKKIHYIEKLSNEINSIFIQLLIFGFFLKKIKNKKPALFEGFSLRFSTFSGSYLFPPYCL